MIFGKRDNARLIFMFHQLEPLKKDRKGQHSVRINDQWRICFVWQRGHAEQLEIVDYY